MGNIDVESDTDSDKSYHSNELECLLAVDRVIRHTELITKRKRTYIDSKKNTNKTSRRLNTDKDNDTFTCKNCPVTFTRADNLNRHKRNKH